MLNPSTFQVYNASAGSGKTFTLVREYLKIILNHPDPRLYQQILAITFTNKAAAEMKDRILDNLLRFSTLEEEDPMLQAIIAETGLDRNTIKLRAKERLQDILKNYASFHIRTIDSFTNKLIKSFAFDLGLSSDFEVELDTDSILKEAVDAVLSRIGIDKGLTSLLVSYARQKTLEDKSWDVSKDLFEISKLILNENHAEALKKLATKDLSSFSDLSKSLRKEQRRLMTSLEGIGNKGLELIQNKGLEHSDFFSSQFPKFFIKTIQQPDSLDFDKSKSLGKNIEQRIFYAKSKADRVGPIIDDIADQLIALYEEAASIFQQLKLNELILNNLVPLGVINEINRALEEIKTNNNIRLNAEFNQLISEHLVNEPAAFIYEKLGERFKYFFIDEMQDTSVLQWRNLIPLIDNALSSEGTGLMLVGDAKQAIYRWRGGRAEQFISLSSDLEDARANPFQTSKLSKSLDTNFRSHSEIVDFNNRFFSNIADHFADEAYKELYTRGNDQRTNTKSGGYISLRFLETLKNAEERDEVYPRLVHETITGLLDQFDPNEICVLVRKKKEGVAIARYLTEQGMDIVSSETLLIKNNVKVNFIIGLLQLLADDKNGDAKFTVLSFLYDHLSIATEKHDFIESLIDLHTAEIFKALEEYQLYYSQQRFSEHSVFEGIEDIVRSFRLTADSDAFIQFFLDFVFDYTQRKSQKNVSFLDYWEEKKEKLNISSSEDLQAVRIMTIHKAKGLEFPVVIYPYDLDLRYERDPKAWYSDLNGEHFNEFDSILVNSSSGIKLTGEHGTAIYEQQQKELELDSFNLLYVCLTRAVEQLYVISEFKEPKDRIRTSAQLFRDFLINERLWEDDNLHYEFGDKRRISDRQENEAPSEIQKEFISSSWNDHQIHIVASSELLWDTERAEAIGYGNLIHEMMERITSENDIPYIIDLFVNKGLVPEKDKQKVYHLIQDIVAHPLLKKYYQPGLTIINEREILTESGQTVIPDRLVIEGKNVSVIDYKTGKPNRNHQLQIDNYALVLQKLDLRVVDKILVYIDDEITVLKS